MESVVEKSRDGRQEIIWRRRDGWREAVPADVLETLPAPSESLPAILKSRFEQRAEQVALNIVSLDGRELVSTPITFARLQQRVERAAVALADQEVAAGDRVILSVDDIEQFVSFFFAAIAMGAIPVPLPPVSEFRMPEAFRERIGSVCRDCRPRVLVGDNRSAWDELDLGGGTVQGFVAAECVDDPGAPEATLPQLDYERSLEETAYLQYTSGSTGHPKGVVVTHGNVVANLRASTLGGHFSRQDRSFSWLPLFHDMGLIGGPLLGLFVGFAPYLTRPSTFVMRPDSWLRGVEQFRATFIVAPNFAYAVAGSKIPERMLEGLDVSSVRLAFNGAEPIDHRTVQRFLDRFEPHGFDPEAFFPVYGLAEATLSVAFPSPGEEVVEDRVDRAALATSGDARPANAGQDQVATYVGVGRVVPEHDLIIRDLETRESLGERRVGEICVRGGSVSPRYFSSDMLDEEDRDELATGDLGYVAEGQLFVVDRIKDLIIIAGQNYAPSDIERWVGRIEGLRKGRVVAFTQRAELGTEQLVVVAEVSPKVLRGLDAIESELRKTVRAHFGLSVASVALVPPQSVPKTSSGKIRRQTTQQLYRSGEFDSFRDPMVRIRATAATLKKTGQGLVLRGAQWLRENNPLND